MNILGVSAGFHDAAITVLDADGNIVFAGHSERYSKKKHDADIHPDLVRELYGLDISDVAYYERPWIKNLRQLYSGQGIAWNQLTLRQIVQKQLRPKILHSARLHSFGHHLSHAAAGFQTSGFDHATVVVVDAVGEFDTITIWDANYDHRGQAQYKKIYSKKYPNSVGLFYSAMTQRVGLKPLDEEYILMGMAAYGRPMHVREIIDSVVDQMSDFSFKDNLHAGVGENFLPTASDQDIACSVQHILEFFVKGIMARARFLGKSQNLVYGGGVALNCTANRLLGDYFEKIWIMPCPGDAGSSLGAAALAHGGRINWTSAFLGHDIPGPYPVNGLLDRLLTERIVGVASGRAEFGPRALGNRSLLADPRGSEIKEKVNAIKRRQQFRPFAPVILEELAGQYFDMPRGWNHSRYMQSVAACRNPDLYPAIVHVDGTSRVQTVPKDGSGIRELLEKWYVVTGCPMLLNTSLNIRGEPMVNDRKDADRFEQLYGVKVCS